MRTFLKPFLLVVLALIFATSLTRLDGRLLPAAGAHCARPANPPIVIVTESCPAPSVGSGLYVRGETPRWAATFIGFALPLVLVAAAFVMAVRRLNGRTRLAAGIACAGAGGYVFWMVSAARYVELQQLHGHWQRLSIWVNDPTALRESLIWLGSGLAAAAGLWLLAMAALSWRQRAMA